MFNPCLTRVTKVWFPRERMDGTDGYRAYGDPQSLKKSTASWRTYSVACFWFGGRCDSSIRTVDDITTWTLPRHVRFNRHNSPSPFLLMLILIFNVFLSVNVLNANQQIILFWKKALEHNRLLLFCKKYFQMHELHALIWIPQLIKKDGKKRCKICSRITSIF